MVGESISVNDLAGHLNDFKLDQLSLKTNSNCLKQRLSFKFSQNSNMTSYMITPYIENEISYEKDHF